MYITSDAYDAAEICGVGRRHYVAADELLFFLWFHTGFEEAGVVRFYKQDIDVACHDHKCKVLVRINIIQHGLRDHDAATLMSQFTVFTSKIYCRLEIYVLLLFASYESAQGAFCKSNNN